jgi:quercetin 2,3-dioxygenase
MDAPRALMPTLRIAKSQTVFPTGDRNFFVMQAFPAGLNEEETDPFLMCDHFGPSMSKGRVTDPDSFPVNWHPHRGMDILTYLLKGVGRHADSLGNRSEYNSPGMQWISVGSGIEHAEGGGTPAGQPQDGFQIWVNVPSAKKMDDPRYGIEPPENIPLLYDSGKTKVRLIAGTVGDITGPFKTVQNVQIVDFLLGPDTSLFHAIPEEMDNCVLLLHCGSGKINMTPLQEHQVIRLDASNPTIRTIKIESEQEGAGVLLFAGIRLNQPIAWYGSFVMTTKEEIQQTLVEYRNGTFLKKRAPWDYKKERSRLAYMATQSESNY